MLLRIILLSLLCHRSSGTRNAVLLLDDSNFTTNIANHGAALVMFYAPWCIHCQNLKPKFESAAQLLQASDVQITLAKVDCTSSGKETCKENQIEGIPRLKVFRNGQYHSDYTGGREVEDIVEFARGDTLQIKNVDSLSDLQETLPTGESVVLGIFKTASELQNVFKYVATKLRHQYNFVQTSNQDILKEHSTENGIVIVLASELRNEYEDSVKAYDGDASEDDLNTFIKQNYYGLVGHRKGKNKVNFNFPIVIVYYKNDSSLFQEWRDKIIEVARIYKENITFAVSPRSMKEYQDFGVLEQYDDDIIVARDSRNRKFVFDDDFFKEDFEDFVKNVLDGKLKPYWKSERVPYKNPGPVKTLVAKSFDQLVLENPRDVFIGFYAPWCPHCRSLEDKYLELARLLEDDDIDIFRMDATANDVPYPFEVEKYPTGYWVPKNGKDSPIKYRGNHTLEEVLIFIAGHATDELKHFDRNGQRKVKDEL